jgi:hypothetical protein
LQRQLIASGLALAAPDALPAACRSDLLAAEADVRRLQQGAWRELMANAADPDAVLARAGQCVLVEGRVASVREAGATLYLNFGRRWTNALAVTISRRIVRVFRCGGDRAQDAGRAADRCARLGGKTLRTTDRTP